MSALEQAQNFLAKSEGMDHEDLREAYDALPSEVQRLYKRLRKESYFKPENEVKDSRKEVWSPSGKYKLVISRFSTGPSTWDYSQGVVYRGGDDTPIATVQRNYGAFPNLFVEGHANGHDYLVCGEDYQGQTVIELDTGKRRELMSDGSDKGWGFCWACYTFNAPNQILAVDGCRWAGPYEVHFFDFSDPMSGWPQIETEVVVDSDDKKAPELSDDGTLRCYRTRGIEDDEDDESTDQEKGVKDPAPVVDVIQTYKREGLRFKLVEEWVSDYERDQRIKRDEAEKKYQEWLANFKATDALYLAYIELVKDPVFSSESSMGMGITYDGWGGSWKRSERRCCRRIVTKKGRKGPTVDLEWGVESGPIKLVLYRDGKSDGHKFFEHSVDGMKKAFAVAKEYAH